MRSPAAWLPLLLAMAWSCVAAPGLSGVWQRIGSGTLLTTAGAAPPWLSGAAREHAARLAAGAPPVTVRDLRACIPGGVPELLLRPEPLQIVQTSALVLFMHQYNHLPRLVYLHSGHPPDPDPTHLGHSVARWDGATLVIDTVGFLDKSAPGALGLPHSAALHVVERLSLRQRGQRLENRVTIDDPAVYAHAWRMTVHYQRRPQLRLEEELCAPH